MSSFSRLLAYARPYRGRLVAAVAAMLFYAAASTGLVTLIKPLMDSVLNDGLALTFWGVPVDLRSWSIAVLVVYFFKGLGSYFSTYLMTDVGQRVVRDLRNQLFRHILNQSAAFFSRRTSGQLMSGITNDVQQIQVAVSETVGDLLREGLAVIGFACAMFYYDYKLALVVVTGAPVVVYPLVRLGQRVRRTSRRVQEELAYMSHITIEAFTGHRIVKAFGAEAHEGSRFERASERLYRTNLKVTSTVSVLPPLMEFLGGVAVVGLISLRQQQDRSARHDAGRLFRVRGRGVHDVRTDQKAQPREHEPAAGDRRLGAHLRLARHALGSARAAASGDARPARAPDRVPRRELPVPRTARASTCCATSRSRRTWGR